MVVAMTGELQTELLVGSRVGKITIVALLKNKHGQKCAIVECPCGNRILRILAVARRGTTCRKCSLRAQGRRVFGGKQFGEYYVAHPSRCAARFAKLVGCSIHEAAQTFDINPGAVWNAWERIYPGLAQPTSSRRRSSTCTACGGQGHVAVNGKCSTSEIAFRLVRGVMKPRNVADWLGLTAKAVYDVVAQRRKAA